LASIQHFRISGLVDEHGQKPEAPEDVLVKQLGYIDAKKDPFKAQKLHAAIGNMLRASGSPRAVSHLEAARDAAKHGGDSDALLASHLELAEVYVEQGRALDSQQEVTKASGVMADHFAEHIVKLNRARGRAKFELGRMDSALHYFEDAERKAVAPEDVAQVACDISMVHTCNGEASKSVELLSHALEVLQAARKTAHSTGMSESLHSSLAADVHFRIAEAQHSMQSLEIARVHYEKALQLQKQLSSFRSERVSAIKAALKNIDRGIPPELHCPTLPHSPWEVPTKLPSVTDPEFLKQVRYMMQDEKYDAAKSKLELALKAFRRPYDSLEASTTLKMLGDVNFEESNIAKASRLYRQAFQAAMACCGTTSTAAKSAYEGLKRTSEVLPDGPDRQRSDLWMRHYNEQLQEEDAAAKAAYVKRMTSGTADDLERKMVNLALEIGKPPNTSESELGAKMQRTNSGSEDTDEGNSGEEEQLAETTGPNDDAESGSAQSDAVVEGPPENDSGEEDATDEDEPQPDDAETDAEYVSRMTADPTTDANGQDSALELKMLRMALNLGKHQDTKEHDDGEQGNDEAIAHDDASTIDEEDRDDDSDKATHELLSKRTADDADVDSQEVKQTKAAQKRQTIYSVF
jgi:tetratricopeptide (TPR) repeat protein